MNSRSVLNITSRVMIANCAVVLANAFFTGWFYSNLQFASVIFSIPIVLAAGLIVSLPLNYLIVRHSLRRLELSFEEISLTDPLTEIGNTRALYRGLATEVERIDRRDKSRPAVFSVLVIDLDGFKQVNDSFGHLTGDAVLKQMADLLRRNIRSTDSTISPPEHFRFGGDEFVIIAPNTCGVRAGMLAERLDQAIGAHPFLTHDGHLLSDTPMGRLRASIGVASFPEDASSTEELLDLADQRMYAVKEERRRRQYCRT